MRELPTPKKNFSTKKTWELVERKRLGVGS